MVFLCLIPFICACAYANIQVSSIDYTDPDVIIEGKTNYLWQQGRMRSSDIDYSSHKIFWIWTSDKSRDIKIHLESLDTSKLLVNPYSSNPLEINESNDIEMTICE